MDGDETVGDAARYLDIAPENVKRRYDIIKGGVDVLRNLHDQKSLYTDKGKVHFVYDRIVVIGHSLGSIIAYDILKHYWSDVNGYLEVDKDNEELNKVENFYWPGEKFCGKERQSYDKKECYRKAQNKLWKTLNCEWLGKNDKTFLEGEAPKARWLVTDLITLGSPLSYGALLLADDLQDFKAKTELRELPICPPDRSRFVNRCGFTVPLCEEADTSKNYDILHHGSMFAVTRWTNLYFPNDLIGGTVENVFGIGIEDINLNDIEEIKDKKAIKLDEMWIELECGSNALSFLESHTSYWNEDSNACLAILRTILKSNDYAREESGN